MLASQNFQSTEDIFHLGIKTIIYNPQNEILVLRKQEEKEYSDLPGGRIQIGETEKQAALREIYEETKITEISCMHYIGMIWSPMRIELENNQTVGIIFSFYKAITQANNVILSDEHEDFKWINPKEGFLLLEKRYGPAFLKLLTQNKL